MNDLFEKSEKLYFSKKYNEALKSFDLLIEEFPDSINKTGFKHNLLTIFNNLDAIELKRDYFDASLNELQKKYSISFDPMSENLWIEEGIKFLEEENYVDAENFFYQVLLLNPKNSEAYNLMGTTQFKQNYYFDSLKSFETAKKYNPNFEIATDMRPLLEKYKLNREGKDVEVYAPINYSYLHRMIPVDDTILYSSLFKASSLTRGITWDTHVLVTDNGIGFFNYAKKKEKSLYPI